MTTVEVVDDIDDEITPSKRPRLSIACNECRRRKVKCDAEYPKCRNCHMRNSECVTTDPRRGGKVAAREWVQDLSVSVTARHSGESRGSNHGTLSFSTRPELAAEEQAYLLSSASAQLGQNQQRNYGNTPVIADHSIPHNTDATSIGVSPVHQPLTFSYNHDSTRKRTKVQGPSSSQCLSRSLDAFFKPAKLESISPLYLHGMRHVEEMIVEPSMGWPELPEVGARDIYVSTFVSRMLPLFPVVIVDQLKTDIALLAAQPRLEDIHSEQVPILLTAYLVFSLGADEAARRPTEHGNRFLRAAASKMSYLILMPYVQSLQCLLLLTVAFRGRNKDGLGWQTLGMAIRMAQSLGLHDAHPTPIMDNDRGQQDLASQKHQHRLWTTCCFLEGMMQLESGRPSSLSVSDIENVLQDHNFRSEHSKSHAFLIWMIELAHFQQRISQHIYAYRPGSRSAQQLLSDTAELDRALTAWVDTIPSQYRPGTEPSCTDDDLPLAAFLSVQYHQTVIALHRAALIAPTMSFDIEVSSLLAGHPSQHRVRKGEAICVSSARTIARIAIDLDDKKASSRALTVGPILLACIVLAIALMKEPKSRLRAADLGLSKTCADFFHEECLRCDMDPHFASAPLKMYDQVNACHKAREERHLREQSTATARVASSTLGDRPALQLQAEAIHFLPADTSLTLNRQSGDEAQMSGANSMNHPENGVGGSAAVENLYSGQHGDLSKTAEQPEGPFTGLNVEDLWNWMLVTDTMDDPQSDIEWLHGANGR